MNIFQISQKDMISKMIKTSQTKPSEQTGHFETFKPLTAVQIYNLVLQCAKFNKLDFGYSNEPLYYIMRDARIILVSATAGAGKTTLTCTKVDREIRLRGADPKTICMLSFNNDSVNDMKKKMLKALNSNNIVTKRFGIFLDEKCLPNIRSLNSLTYNIVDQFKDYWHLGKVDIISNEDAILTMTKTLNSFEKDKGMFTVSDSLITNCLSIYDLLNETLKTIDEIKNLSAVVDTGLPPQLLNEIIESYRERLLIQNKFHHSDTARLILERCKVDTEFKSFLQNIYKLIVIDELQDISEAVFQLLKIMVNDKNSLIAIGDGDQSIYGFKGARADTCFKFKEDFPDAVLCTLSVNRRCASNILDYAKAVVANINNRIPQDLKAIRPDGEVIVNYYEESAEVIKNIAEYLSKIPKDKLGTMCIGFRKNVTCYYIAQKLMEEGIPFRVRPEMMPGADKLSGHLKAIFTMLKSPSNLNLAIQSLYKVLPIRKIPENKRESYINELEEYMDENDLEYFYELPIEKFNLRSNMAGKLAEQLNTLREASNLIRKHGTMKQILDLVFPLFEKNFWNFTRAVTSFQPELEAMVLDVYSKEETYVEFQHRRMEMEANIERYISRGYGVKLSSFHSLKGLEFDEVFLVELDNKNLPLIRCSDSATDEELSNLIDEELRLFYVAVTRAKNKLHLFWSSRDRSPFIDLNKKCEAEPPESDLVFDLDFDDTTTESDLVFDLDFDTTTPEPPQPQPEPPSPPPEPPSPQPSPLPTFNLSSNDDFIETSIHLREDFVDVKNGNELENVLGFICRVVNAGGA